MSNKVEIRTLNGHALADTKAREALESKQPKGDYATRDEIPSVPVQSVNDKTGAVQLTAVDVGALPADTQIPAPYILTTASETVKGGVKVGAGLWMDGDVLNTEVTKEDVDKLSEDKVDKALFNQVFEIREASINLYNPLAEGWLASSAINSNGSIQTNDTKNAYFVTHKIPLSGGTYTISPSPSPKDLPDANAFKAYDNADQPILNSTMTRIDGGITFNVPANTAYVRFTVFISNFTPYSTDFASGVNGFKQLTMIVKGENIPSEYVPYYPAGNAMKNIAIPDESVILKTIGDDAKPVIAPMMGKKIANFGDSIFGNARPPVDVSTYIAANTGATVYNCAFGGCRMATHVGHWDAFSMYRLAYSIANNDYSVQDDAIGYDDRTSYAEEPLAVIKSIDFANLDILTIAYGANDFTGNNQIDNADNLMDTSTVCGALRYSIETLLSAYPNLRIFVLLPTYRFWVDADNDNAFVEDSSTYTNNLGKTLAEYSNAIAEIAKAYNLPVIDNYTELGINKVNRYQYFGAADGAHHIEAGRKLLAKHIAAKLW